MEFLEQEAKSVGFKVINQGQEGVVVNLGVEEYFVFTQWLITIQEHEQYQYSVMGVRLQSDSLEDVFIKIDERHLQGRISSQESEEEFQTAYEVLGKGFMM